ncbi:winged helix-turn-helix domain-containing protein [Megalodesulfovibrio gigas]|uniref:Putative ModE family transcriptional regulator n=1 Tax=Megalodesulfovibrio gigas (strain ATCC 19364 / DSM 1382 / NCIMB 9332 / VKM B-1759) TaxID=1121448 RepID=T2G7V5_MEGG1|nr:LysR family transcriptional regulator [Megalodesulfovibrio gigas]AGW12655.1 putative ModE family transcriptional regulator [Megalodesulfovibrio gigas DSM 1382 = ATCC 19364]
MESNTPPGDHPGNLAMHFRAHVWLERDGTVLLGPGRALLLERIDQMGSLRKASQSMSMSYRAAWGKIKKTEALLGQAVVEKTGHDRSGYSLTPYGKQVLALFLAVQRHVNLEAASKAQALEALETLGVMEPHHLDPVQD